MSIQSQHGLYSHIDASKIVLLKHHVAHLFSIFQRIQWRFRQQNFAASRINLHLLVESEIPQMLHVVPDLHNAVLHLYMPVVSLSLCTPLYSSSHNGPHLRTGYVICNIERAAAASSPHMISLTTMSPARSSERRIGRPTMEGYECSGKFYSVSEDDQHHFKYHSALKVFSSFMLTCAAYPTLRNPVPPSRTSASQYCWTRMRHKIIYLWVPLPS